MTDRFHSTRLEDSLKNNNSQLVNQASIKVVGVGGGGGNARDSPQGCRRRCGAPACRLQAFEWLMNAAPCVWPGKGKDAYPLVSRPAAR